jgi:transposase-like protein
MAISFKGCMFPRISFLWASAGMSPPLEHAPCRRTHDQRAVKRVTRPMLGCKSFDTAQNTLVGIELMHMIKKRQLVVEAGEESLTATELFYALAA